MTRNPETTEAAKDAGLPEGVAALWAAADAIDAANGRTPEGFDIAHASGWLRHRAWMLADDEPPAAVLVVSPAVTEGERAAWEDQTAYIERACKVMHDAYEQAAVAAGWETNYASRVQWPDVPEANKAAMRAAVEATLFWHEACRDTPPSPAGCEMSPASESHNPRQAELDTVTAAEDETRRFRAALRVERDEAYPPAPVVAAVPAEPVDDRLICCPECRSVFEAEDHSIVDAIPDAMLDAVEAQWLADAAAKVVASPRDHVRRLLRAAFTMPVPADPNEED